MEKIRYIYLQATMMSLLLLVTVIPIAIAEDLGSGTPNVRITSPNDNATLPAGDDTLDIQVDDFALENKSGAATNVTPGMHNFTAELVNNVDTPLDPAKYATINVIVTATAAEASGAASSSCGSAQLKSIGG